MGEVYLAQDTKQTSPHNSLQMIWRVGTEVADRRNRFADNLVERINRVFALEGLVARYCLKQNAAEGKNI